MPLIKEHKQELLEYYHWVIGEALSSLPKVIRYQIKPRGFDDVMDTLARTGHFNKPVMDDLQRQLASRTLSLHNFELEKLVDGIGKAWAFDVMWGFEWGMAERITPGDLVLNQADKFYDLCQTPISTRPVSAKAIRAVRQWWTEEVENERAR